MEIAHAREEARKLDEEDEKDIIAVCCVLIVLIVSRTHRARTSVASGELRGQRRATVPRPVGRGISRVGQIDPVPASGC